MDYNLLFSPITINRMRLANRVVMAPVHEALCAEDGSVSQRNMDFYLRRAKGGVGMLAIGAIYVSSRRRPHVLRINDDKFIPGLKDMVDRIHAETDAKVCAQLYDAMRLTRDGSLLQLQRVTDLTAGDIQQIIVDFESAAGRAREAGFDGIELHAAHGYTLAAFLSLRNKRTDDYGGSIDGRMKLVLEVYQRVRRLVGTDYPVGVRVNGDEFIVDGNTLHHSRIIARTLAGVGIDYISVTAGGKYEDSQGRGPTGVPLPYAPYGGYSGFRSMPAAYMPEGVNVYLAEDVRRTLRQAGYSTPVMTAGRIPHPRLAEAILEKGQADLIGLCRALLRDPDWPIKARDGRARAIVRCTYCNDCLASLTEPNICPHSPEYALLLGEAAHPLGSTPQV